jgi:hypothetical protein
MPYSVSFGEVGFWGWTADVAPRGAVPVLDEELLGSPWPKKPPYPTAQTSVPETADTANRVAKSNPGVDEDHEPFQWSMIILSEWVASDPFPTAQTDQLPVAATPKNEASPSDDGGDFTDHAPPEYLSASPPPTAHSVDVPGTRAIA